MADMKNDEDKPAERQPPFTALRAFEAAARNGSFARAADELGVSAAAVSQQIQQMEEFAGQPLFRRLGRGVELTDAGKAALPHLTQAMASLAEAARMMRLPLRSRRVAVSAPPSFAIKWLAPRLESFKERCPDVEVWLSAEMGLVDFAVADVDLAVRYGPGGYEGIYAHQLMGESVIPVCSRALVEGEFGLRRPEDLSRHALLHDESPDGDVSCPTWSMWLAARGVEGVDARRGLRFNQSSLVLEAASAGRGVALAKRRLAAQDLSTGRLVAPFDEAATPVNFAYWLVWPRGRTMSPALKAFIDWIKDEAGAVEPDLGGGI